MIESSGLPWPIALEKTGITQSDWVRARTFYVAWIGANALAEAGGLGTTMPLGWSAGPNLVNGAEYYPAHGRAPSVATDIVPYLWMRCRYRHCDSHGYCESLAVKVGLMRLKEAT